VAGRTRSSGSAAANPVCGPACARPKTPWVLESTARCSVKSPKGAATREGLAGSEGSRRQDNMPHGEVRGVLLGRQGSKETT
jgi:hypothetical protein